MTKQVSSDRLMQLRLRWKTLETAHEQASRAGIGRPTPERLRQRDRSARLYELAHRAKTNYFNSELAPSPITPLVSFGY